MALDPTPKPLSWQQLSQLIFVLTTVFYAGAMYRRVVVLENWRVQVTARAELYDTRARNAEAMLASILADQAALKSAVMRIERAIDAGNPP